MWAYGNNNPIKYTDPDGREVPGIPGIPEIPECYIGPATRKMSPEWVMKIDDAVTRFTWRNFGFFLSQEPDTVIKTMDGRLITLTESGVAFSNSEKVTDCMFFCITAAASVFKLAKASSVATKIPNIVGTGEYGKVSSAASSTKKITASDIVFSDKFSKPGYRGQVAKRGWTLEKIADAINNPLKTSSSVNKATGNSVTRYYVDNIHYVAQDDVTKKIIQVADLFDPNWK